tara:strand:- start:7605 stop:10580 length:2976 start_codon:yes stop_codon:yes gene_type:complete
MADNSLDPKKYQQVVELLKEIRRGYESLGQANPFTGQTAREFIDAMEDADDAIIKLVDGVDELDKQLDNVGKNAKGYFETLIGLNGAIKKQNESLNITKRATNQIQGIAEKLKDDQEGINRLNAKELAQLQQKYKSQLSNFQIANKEILLGKDGEKLNEANLKKRLASLLVAEKITEGHADMIMEMQAESSVLTDINQKLADRTAKEEKVAGYNELTNKALDSAGGLMKSLGFGKYADMFKDISKEANELTEELYDQQQAANDFNTELKKAKANGERTGEELKDLSKLGLEDADIEAKVLGDTLVKGATKFKKEMLAALDVAILKGLKDGIKKFGEEREDLAKTFALGRDDANNLKSSLNVAANSSGELHFNIADAVKGIQEFNQEIGGAVKLTQDELKTFSLLSNEFGLTNEQAAQFVKSAKLRGESAEDLTATLRGQVAILAEQEGVAVNQQQTFAAIGNISAANRLSMEGQGKSLANAAFQAAKLGMSQSQLEKTSSSLLDFESSIAAEMEAELMTGKQLNLEDARRAALMGDQEGLAKAISREIGTAKDFSKMNVLQQQSLAKAFGMSREELAETLETQELLTGEAKSMTAASDAYNKAMEDGVITADEQRQIGSDQLTDQLHAEAASKRFADAMVKLKDTLTPIMESISKILDGLMDMVEAAQSVGGLFTSIGKYMGIISGIRIFARMKAGLGVLKNMFGFLTKIGGAASSLASTLGFGSTAASSTASTAANVSGGVAGASTKAAASTVGQAGATSLGAAGGGVMSKIGGFFSKLNPINALKDAIKPVIGKGALGATLKSLTKRIPIIGSFIEGVFANSDIKGMIADGKSKKDIDVAIGKRVNEGIGAVIGSAGGMAAIQALNIAPGLGLALTPVAGIAGDWLGRRLGGMMPGQESVGGIVRNTFYDKESEAAGVAEDFISRPGQPIQKFRADDIVMAGTNLTGGGDNSQVVTLLKELISAVKSGGDVYIDGAKAGKAMVMATSNI